MVGRPIAGGNYMPVRPEDIIVPGEPGSVSSGNLPGMSASDR